MFVRVLDPRAPHTGGQAHGGGHQGAQRRRGSRDGGRGQRQRLRGTGTPLALRREQPSHGRRRRLPKRSRRGSLQVRVGGLSDTLSFHSVQK